MSSRLKFARHRMAYPENGIELPHQPLLGGGEYQRLRRDGEPHLFNPETVFRLQHATRERRYDIFKAYTRGVDDQSENLDDPARLLKFKAGLRPRCRLRKWSRSPASSALLHRRHELRLHFPGGPRDARDRHEPAGRQVQHR